MSDVAELIRLETAEIDRLTDHIRAAIERLKESQRDRFTCRGCGEEVSGEFGDICRACEREQEAERKGDLLREERGSKLSRLIEE